MNRHSNSLAKQNSEESFNVEKFKDRLFNLSHTAGKEKPSASKAFDGVDLGDSIGLSSDKRPTNIIIKTVSDQNKSFASSSKQDQSALQDPLYEKIRLKYMQNSNSIH